LKIGEIQNRLQKISLPSGGILDVWIIIYLEIFTTFRNGINASIMDNKSQKYQPVVTQETLVLLILFSLLTSGFLWLPAVHQFKEKYSENPGLISSNLPVVCCFTVKGILLQN
jgi:glucan phosphoethanolaminetransferase (alkaline phosphatase superfamily)